MDPQRAGSGFARAVDHTAVHVSPIDRAAFQDGSPGDQPVGGAQIPIACRRPANSLVRRLAEAALVVGIGGDAVLREIGPGGFKALE